MLFALLRTGFIDNPLFVNGRAARSNSELYAYFIKTFHFCEDQEIFYRVRITLSSRYLLTVGNPEEALCQLS